MKILFISRIYPSIYDEADGAVMHRQVKELIKQGNEVVVLSPKPKVSFFIKKFRKKWNDYYNLPTVDSYEDTKVYRPTFYDLPYGLNRGRKYKSMIIYSRKIIDHIYSEFPFDLVHTHMVYPDNHLGVYLKQKYKIPLVTTVRSTDLDISIKHANIKELMKSSLNYSDVIVSPSIQLSDKLKKELNFESVHIGNGIYPNELMKIKSIKVEENEIKIVSISNLMKSKGIQHKILAIKELIKEFPTIKYYIIGKGDYKNELLKLVKDYNLEKHIIFLGALNHKEAMAHLKSCTIFSMPSWRETFGLVYLEALYFKKPILLCEKQGIDGSVINNHSAIIVENKSTQSVKYGLYKLLQNQELRKRISENGYNIVINNYTWNKIGEKLNELYKSILLVSIK